jgi:hypothetical protein
MKPCNKVRMAIGLLLLAASALVLPAQAANEPTIGKPMYGVWPLDPAVKSLAPLDSVLTVPHWTNSFKVKDVTYNYRMVGTSPFSGSATTTVPVQLVPLKFVFANGTELDGSLKINAVKNSPLFMATTFSSGTTQYVDAVQRAEFWTVVNSKSPNYHLLLGEPDILPAKTVMVPSNMGVQFTAAGGQQVGLVDLDWFSAQLSRIFRTAHLSPTSLAMLVDYNVFFYANHDIRECCVLGFHGAYASSRTRINTFAFAAYSDPGLFLMEDITALSHEVAEWANNPFLSNQVPIWANPGTNKCFSNLLEVGDPIAVLKDLSFPVPANGATYHLQDVAGISWFAHQVPSMQQNGKYSFTGSLASVPGKCQ